MCAVVSVPMSAEQELVDAFSNELLYLTRPTRYDIESVTNNFVKGQAQAAPMLAAALEEHLMKCEPHLKVPALFLLDHIAKTVPIPYQALFSTRLHQVFTTARQQARESDQPSFAKVLQAWTTQGIFSGQLLHALHPTAPTVTASQMPPAGLSSAQPAAMQTVAPPVQQPVVMNGMHSTASIPGNAQHVPVPLQQMQAVHPVPTQVPTLQPQPGPQPGPQPVPHPAVQLPQTLQPVHQAVLQPFGHPIAQPIGQPAMGVQLLSSLPQAAPGGAAQYVTCQPMAGIAGPLSGVGQGLVPSMTVVSASVVQRPVVAPIQLQGGGRQLLPYQQAYAVRQPPVLLPAQPAQQPAAAAAPLPAQPAASEPPQASVSVLLDSLASSMAKSTNRDDPGLLTETQFDPKRLKGFNQLALEQLKKDSAKTRPALIDLQIQRRRNRESGVKSKTWFVSAKRWVAGATLSDPDPALLGVQQCDGEVAEAAPQRQEYSVPQDETQTHCALSGEKFETQWNEAAEQWHYKDARRLGQEEAAALGLPEGSIVLSSCLEALQQSATSRRSEDGASGAEGVAPPAAAGVAAGSPQGSVLGKHRGAEEAGEVAPEEKRVKLEALPPQPLAVASAELQG